MQTRGRFEMKVFSICTLCTLLSGCFMSHEEVAGAVNKCSTIGGKALVEKLIGGRAGSVICIVDDVTYSLGDF